MNSKYEDFKLIIRECDYDNTYKMAWAKSLVEIANEIKVQDENTLITLEKIANKYIKYYWNQTIFFNLIQGSNPKKPPKVLSAVKDLISLYFEKTNSNKPELFEKAESRFSQLYIEDNYKKLVKQVVGFLKKDVSWRFPLLSGKDTKVYDYIKGNDYILIDNDLVNLFKENEKDLYDLINYRWGIILETFNSSPRINKKVRIMDERDIKRSSLNVFKKYLDCENKEHICFDCGKKIQDHELSIDHVIPWSYLYSDDIWNLVYVCKSCNSKKSNTIPNQQQIDKLKQRNERLYKTLKESDILDKKYMELELAIEKDYVNKFWIGSKS